MFEPVGLEFLYTNVYSPQVLVEIDDLPALCVNRNCDYAYVDVSGLVSSFSYDAATRSVTVQGASLPTRDVSVSFGGAECVLNSDSTLTKSLIVCKLEHGPRSGSHQVQVKDP